jgi:beta-N-acetylglucosaminidase
MEYKKASEIAREYYFVNYSRTEISVNVVFHRYNKELKFPHCVLKKTKKYNIEQINKVLAKNNKPILKKRENEKI